VQDDIARLAYEVFRITEEKIGRIDRVMKQTGMLAINARLEAARAGEAGHRAIASSDGEAAFGQAFPLVRDARSSGYYMKDKALIAFAETPGYETYRGLGWYGCIESLQDEQG
jgi:hypothetical protein